MKDAHNLSLREAKEVIDHLEQTIIMTPSEKWKCLKQEILNRIDQIDKETEWSPTEPKWWLEMMEIRDHIQ